MLKLLPLARRTSHATRMLVSTRSMAALVAPPSSRYHDTPVTQMPKRRMPEIDKVDKRRLDSPRYSLAISLHVCGRLNFGARKNTGSIKGVRPGRGLVRPP